MWDTDWVRIERPAAGGALVSDLMKIGHSPG